MEAFVDEACRRIASAIPYESLHQYTFMQRALVGMLLIAPLCSTIGIQVVNFRLAFFAEAIGHSAYTGLAIGLLAGTAAASTGMVDPTWAMAAFGVLVAVGITYFRRRSSLSSDTIVGVFSSAVIALGLCLISRLIETSRIERGGAQLMAFLQGNILSIQSRQLAALLAFFVVAMALQTLAYNRLLFVGVNADLAQTLGVRVRIYEYLFAVLLALVVMFSIQAVGVLLVTAMLVIPAAAARNLARSAGGLFWWGLVVSTTSAVGGLIASDYWSTATGATTVLLTALWFLISALRNWAIGLAR